MDMSSRTTSGRVSYTRDEWLFRHSLVFFFAISIATLTNRVAFLKEFLATDAVERFFALLRLKQVRFKLGF